MTITTAVTQSLDQLDIPYRIFVHAKKVETFEQAAAERDQKPEQIVRSLLFRLDKESFVMVLMAGPQQVPWGALRRLVGKSRLTMAKPDQVFEVTGYQIGAVSPIGLKTDMPIYIDERILEQDEISIGSGVRGTAVMMAPDQLKTVLDDFTIVSLT